MTSALNSAPPHITHTLICPPARPRLRQLRYEPHPGEFPEPADRTWHPAPVAAASRTAVPGAREAVIVILRLACEVLDGRRPPQQLARHVDEPVLRYWRATAGRREVRSPARFDRLRIGHPHPGAAEVAVAVELDGRVRALAARFDLTDERWLWTAARLG